MTTTEMRAHACRAADRRARRADAARGEAVVRDLDGVVSFYKIGYQLAFAGGLDFARELAAGGTKIFLDMKLLDIDNTVAKGVENIAKMGMSMLTLHAYPKAMKAAVEAAQGRRPLPARRDGADLDGRAGPDRRRLRIRPAYAGAAPRRAGACRPAWAASSARRARRRRCARSSDRSLRS